MGLSYPKGGETFNPGDIITITWFIEADHGDCTWDLYYSINGGITWQPIKAGISKSQLQYDWTIPDSLANTSCKIKVVQNNNGPGAYSDMSSDFIIIEVTTGVITGGKNVNKFILYPAYPNPFNPSTKIKYAIPEQSRVKVNVYNTIGKRVAELVNNDQQAGNYNLTWKAANLPSGFYFLVIEAVSLQSHKKFLETSKIILLK